MKVSDVLNNIDNESLALPVFQRGYVWKRPQVKTLLYSLYHGYPVGSLLTWATRAEQVEVRGGNQERTSGAIELLLDGQQRVTSLYGIIRGKAPSFFDGDDSAFSGLYFNLDSEEFEFLTQTRADSDPLWVKTTQLLDDNSTWMTPLVGNPHYTANLDDYLQRGMKVRQIRDTDLPLQQITGEDKTTDVVVDIFNRVNSGGTKLSKGDLALARIGARWPGVREEMQQRLSKWKKADFDANLDWLLRCMNAILTRSSEFERLELERVGVERIREALSETENAVDRLLEGMRSHLHMDADRLHKSKQAFPVMVNYLVDCGGKFPDRAATARLLHWYVSASIWGRFSGPTETIINQDLSVLTEADPISGLLRNLRVSQGERAVTHENFNLNYTKARFYPLLYMMSRIQGSQDWKTGNQLRHHSLGDHTKLEMHHIFPKAYLSRNGISANDANNMGNIAFQTRETNQSIGAKPPIEYMPEVAESWPGALESQWIPTDPELWKVENYHRFLDARRRLLADSANVMLNTLKAGNIPPQEIPETAEQQTDRLAVAPVEAKDILEDEDAIISAANRLAQENGLAAGELGYELFGENGDEPLATVDVAWPNGLQSGYSQPVALMIEEEPEVRTTVSNAGFKVFRSLDELRRYVNREILAETIQ